LRQFCWRILLLCFTSFDPLFNATAPLRNLPDDRITGICFHWDDGLAVPFGCVVDGRTDETGDAMKGYKFKAKIEPSDGGGAYVLFPYDVEKEFGTKGKVPVKAAFDGVPYAGSLIKYSHPQHMLPILKAIREQTGKGPGDTVDVELWKDDGPKTLVVPAQFKDAMKKEGVITLFDRLSYTHRKEYCRWITEAKKEETRLRRLEKAVEMLKKGVCTPG
jgi:uncharacterized protein DUF1905/bacteriocin resistance YdeI/OmpD-like protein